MSGNFGSENDVFSLHVVEAMASTPFTYAGWGYLTDTSAPFKAFMGQGNGTVDGTTGRREWLYIETGSAGNPITYNSNGPGNDVVLESSIGTTINTWTHFAATDTGTAQEIFTDGVSGGTASVTLGTRTKDETAIGVRINGDEGYSTKGWAGRIAEVGIWNRILSAGEIAALAAGYAPSFFPRGLVLYRDLIRELTTRPGYGSVLTNTSVTVGLHDVPGIIYPSRPHSITVPAAVGGGGDIPIFMRHYLRMMGSG